MKTYQEFVTELFAKRENKKRKFPMMTAQIRSDKHEKAAQSAWVDSDSKSQHRHERASDRYDRISRGWKPFDKVARGKHKIFAFQKPESRKKVSKHYEAANTKKKKTPTT